MSLLRRASEFVRPDRRALVLVALLASFTTGLAVLEPLVVKRVFDILGGDGGPRALFLAGGALLALELARAAFTGILSVRSWDVRLALEYRLRERLVARLNELPLSYHQRETVGGLTNRMTSGVAGVVSGFAEVAFTLVPTLLYLALAAVVMWRLDPRLALVVLVMTPLPALIGARAAPEQTRRERRLLERWTSLYSRFNEVLAGIGTVKGFAMEGVEERRFLAGVRQGFATVRRGVRRDTLTGTLRGLAGTLARLATILLGGALVARGEMSLGTLVAFLGYLTGFFGPVQNLTNAYQTLRKMTVSLRTVYGILDADDPVADAAAAREAAPLRGQVEFRDVCFGYEAGRPVLRDVHLTVRPGERIALVGASGSGKSTLVALLQRHHALTGGRILVDGMDIQALTRRSLRRQVGVVSQEIHLFNDSVRANLAYARPEATDAEVEAAARAANAHEFILALPRGYATRVGERGGRLSGGQRQRLAIARALLADAPILVLDEATSALDPAGAAAVQEALHRLTRGRTTFVIAHRVQAVADADRILLLERGAIVAMGTHAQLLESSAAYAHLVQCQAGPILAAS